MTDVHNKKTRSYNMSRIKGKNTEPEKLVRKFLFANGFRYRLNVKTLPGKPDIVLPKYKTVIFIDGDYWHGHQWAERKKKVKTNREFWIAKIERNMQRDREVNAAYLQVGYTVFRFWESEIKKDLQLCLDKVVSHLQAQMPNS